MFLFDWPRKRVRCGTSRRKNAVNRTKVASARVCTISVLNYRAGSHGVILRSVRSHARNPNAKNKFRCTFRFASEVEWNAHGTVGWNENNWLLVISKSKSWKKQFLYIILRDFVSFERIYSKLNNLDFELFLQKKIILRSHLISVKTWN